VEAADTDSQVATKRNEGRELMWSDEELSGQKKYYRLLLLLLRWNLLIRIR
jgi:hypothetical protein